jgi:threonine synthase
MKKQLLLECPTCGFGDTLRWKVLACPRCGGEWLEVRYEHQALRDGWPRMLQQRPFDMWRYWEMLPLRHRANIVSMGEGGTPLVHATNVALMLGRHHIYVKDERQGPTGSFKDRQAALAISVMKEQGIREAVVASTGNVAISYSAYSARIGLKLWTFVTSSVPADKMREVALYGSEVIKVTGTYDQTKEVAAQFAERKGFHLDRGIKSLAARESMKTLAFEIAEQLGPVMEATGAGGRRTDARRQATGTLASPWRAPDWYIQSVSGGMGPVGVWKGFQELYDLGLVDRIPRLACIQAEGCAPMVRSFRKGLLEAEPVLNPQTLITTVATGKPGLAYSFLRRVILEGDGAMEMVSDDEAFRAMHILAKMDGLSMEPAAGIAFAGLVKLVEDGIIKPDEVVVVNCSGHTFPVEKHLLGDAWARDLDPTGARPEAEEEGLLTSIDRLDTRIHRVAILEDDPDSARLLRRILQARGDYQISEAYDGRAGLELIRQERPDLVLLDLMMPEMDGFQVLDAIRQDEQLRETRVIVVTAKSLTVAERRRLSGRIERLLEKGSFLDDDLLEEILEAIG